MIATLIVFTALISGFLFRFDCFQIKKSDQNVQNVEFNNSFIKLHLKYPKVSLVSGPYFGNL